MYIQLYAHIYIYFFYLIICLYACVVEQRKILRGTYHLLNMNGDVAQVKKEKEDHINK